MKSPPVQRILTPLVSAVTVCVLSACSAIAQTAPAPPANETTAAPASAPPSGAVSTERGWANGFLRDVGGDYLHFLSKENAVWLGIGGAAALAVHPADDNLSEWAQEANASLSGAATYGSQLVHIPVAIGIWAIGAASGSDRFAETGRDLLRAQIAVVSWTFAIKVATDRTRPNGDPRSFPSGHASTSFATAMVLQEHLGWKVGLPAFAAATYTAASRVTANQHWASDVVFGAAVGLASGRTVTIRLREAHLVVAPLVAAGGGGVLVTASRKS